MFSSRIVYSFLSSRAVLLFHKLFILLHQNNRCFLQCVFLPFFAQFALRQKTLAKRKKKMSSSVSQHINSSTSHFQHKYGGIYAFIKIMKNKTTDEAVVHYKHVYPYPEHEAVRSPEDFFTAHRPINDDAELTALLAKPAEEFQLEIAHNMKKK